MKRGRGKREEEWSKDARQTRMEDALVTHDGPREQDAEKMYIRSDRDMAEGRRAKGD